MMQYALNVHNGSVILDRFGISEGCPLSPRKQPYRNVPDWQLRAQFQSSKIGLNRNWDRVADATYAWSAGLVPAH